MDEDLILQIKQWYSTQGYSFEMRSARKCMSAGFGAQLGTFFSDPTTGKRRELDLVATRWVKCGMSDTRLCLHLIIQCKFAPRPWLFFAPSTTNSRALDPSLLKDTTGNCAVYMWPEVQNLPEYGFFRGWEHSAYGGTTVPLEAVKKSQGQQKNKADNRDLAYEALTSVNAAYEKWRAPKSALSVMPGERLYRLTFPVVFVKGSLFTAHLVDEDDIITQAQIVRVSWKGGEAGNENVIDIVEASSIDNYLRQLNTEIDLMALAIQNSPDWLERCGRPSLSVDEYRDE